MRTLFDDIRADGPAEDFDPFPVAAPPIAANAAWVEARRMHPGMSCLVRVGDWYETYGDDARTVGKVCGLTVTTKAGTPLAGFPASRLEVYLGQMLRAGLRVAVCDPGD